jgi:hypothetical protein
MDGINYYDLLKEGVEAFPTLDWKHVVKSVVDYRRDLEEPDSARQALENILLDCSQDWVDRRTKIVKEAAANHSNPSLRSKYCLTALREMADEFSREAARQRKSPEAATVRRQVSDHLRGLHKKGEVVSSMVRTKAGKDRFKLWGLKEWGENWVKKQPVRSMDEVKKDLPIIPAYRDRKAIFDYAAVLPIYIPKVFQAAGAGLCTDEVSSAVCSRVSPPLSRNPNTPSPFEDSDPGGEYGPVSSPDDLMREAQLMRTFLSLLTEKELGVFKMSEEGASVDEIAASLACAPRTVNNYRKSIFEKCRTALEV